MSTDSRALAEKRPEVPDWDGDRTRLLLWLHQVDQIRQTKEIPDPVGLLYALFARRKKNEDRLSPVWRRKDVRKDHKRRPQKGVTTTIKT